MKTDSTATPIEVTITQEDIDQGVRMDCYKCPGARAIQRALPDGLIVTVAGDSLSYNVRTYTRIRIHTRSTDDSSWTRHYEATQAPEKLRNFIRKFDHKIPVKPITFTIYLTRALLDALEFEKNRSTME